MAGIVEHVPEAGVVERITARSEGNAFYAEDPFGLTPREREVLVLVSAGLTNREIGERLFITDRPPACEWRVSGP